MQRPQSRPYLRISETPASLPGLLFARQSHGNITPRSTDVTIVQEGAFRRGPAHGPDRGHEHERREAHDPDLVAGVDDLPRDGRAHDRGPRRPQARPRVRDRADGRAQARGVRPDAHLQGPRRRPRDAGEKALMATLQDDRMRVRAQAKWVRTSARKARLVLDHIRGRSVPEARTILAFTQRAAATDIEKVLRSAVANAEANHGLDGDELVVEAAFADEGPTLKRWKPRARGRVNRIRKRTCHVTLILAERPEPTTPKRRRGSAKPTTEEQPAVKKGSVTKPKTTRARKSKPKAPAQTEEAVA